MGEFLPSFPNALGRITWRDMLCMTALKASLPVAVRKLFRFAVAASEIVTVMTSNSLFISFWRSFREIFWQVLWTLKLTQSQVGIVGLKIVNSLWISQFHLRPALAPGYCGAFARLVSPAGGDLQILHCPAAGNLPIPGPFPSFWHALGFLSEYNYIEGFSGKNQIGSSVKDRNKL